MKRLLMVLAVLALAVRVQAMTCDEALRNMVSATHAFYDWAGKSAEKEGEPLSPERQVYVDQMLAHYADVKVATATLRMACADDPIKLDFVRDCEAWDDEFERRIMDGHLPSLRGKEEP